MNRFSLSFVAFPLILLTGCTWEKMGPEVCFETEILPVFQSSCANSGCHNPIDRVEGYDFTTYDGIMGAVRPFKPLLSPAYRSISGNLGEAMPPAPYTRLPDATITIVKRWIDQGAKNTTNCISACDTTTAKYAANILPIMQRYCNGCHQAGGSNGGYDFTTYTDLKLAADNGALLGAVRQTGSFSPMPKNGSKLSACNISLIEKWVREGAQNN